MFDVFFLTCAKEAARCTEDNSAKDTFAITFRHISTRDECDHNTFSFPSTNPDGTADKTLDVLTSGEMTFITVDYIEPVQSITTDDCGNKAAEETTYMLYVGLPDTVTQCDYEDTSSLP